MAEPSLVVTVTDEHWEGVRLVAITVPRSPTVHQVTGRVAERVGASCEPMSAERIAAVAAERHGQDWSAEDAHVPLDRVSARALEETRSLLNESLDLDRQQWAAVSAPDLLTCLGVVAPSGHLTNAGVQNSR